VILTTAADAVVQPVHERMPMILDRSEYGRWLNTRSASPFSPAEFKTDHTLIATPVSQRVNNIQNDGPSCIEDEEVPPTLFS
jgi:putative SOS response-associated peptidase YedK